jgi:hypothetical protein
MIRRYVILLVALMTGLMLLESSPAALADDDGCGEVGNFTAVCVSGVDWAGQRLYQISNGVVQYAIVQLNNRCSASTPLVAHELGHAIDLEHDGMDPDGPDQGALDDRDNKCWPPDSPPRVPQTIMDYDCYLQPPFLTGAVNWDFCGINHKYFSSSIGLVGC